MRPAMTELERVQLERERLQVKRERLTLRQERQAMTDARRGERRVQLRAGWERFKLALPMRVALCAVAMVWLLGCLWSLREQAALAAHSGFLIPWVLGLILDGLAVACAVVSYAASLDGRAAVKARLVLAAAVVASAGSNGVWAWERSGGQVITIALAVGVPVAANVAFEVLLGERRLQVKRRRGLPAPIPVEPPRLIRLVLSPIAEPRAWRAWVLATTAPAPVDEQITQLEQLLLERATRRRARAERKAARRRERAVRRQERDMTRRQKNPLQPTADAKDAGTGPASGPSRRRVSRNASGSARGEKTTRLRQLLGEEVPVDDTRSDAELARIYAPRVDMHGSSARKVIAAFRADRLDASSDDNSEGRVLRLAGGGQ